MSDAATGCRLCPRRCGADRSVSPGRCHGGGYVLVARAAPHYWEEPCISGMNGSGAVFFSGCPLGCRFCQNLEIRDGRTGTAVAPEQFARICLRLRDQGVHNIDLVTADHYLETVAPVMRGLKEELRIPVVYNCSGYETDGMLDLLEGIVDVFLPDMKFRSPDVAEELAGARDYPAVAEKAIRRMADMTGSPVFDRDGMLVRGTLVRHLIIPGFRRDSLEVVRWLGETFGKDEILVSLMSQFTPNGEPGTPDRRITAFEYGSVADALEPYGFRGYLQGRTSSGTEYVPPFDLNGVL